MVEIDARPFGKDAARLRGKSTQPGKRATENQSVMALVASFTMKKRGTLG